MAKKQARPRSPEHDEHIRLLGKSEAKRIEHGKQPEFPGFARCLEMMRAKNHVTQEDGFYFLLPHAHQYLDELLAAFQTEEDRSLKGWLLELIGSTASPRAFPLLLECWLGEDRLLHCWAEPGLKKLGT